MQSSRDGYDTSDALPPHVPFVSLLARASESTVVELQKHELGGLMQQIKARMGAHTCSPQV